MLKYFILAIITIQFNNSQSQDKSSNIEKIIGYWQSLDDSSTYRLYTTKFVYDITHFKSGSIPILKFMIGFSDDCPISTPEHLKSTGIYYFELMKQDFESQNSIDKIKCFDFKILKDGRLRLFDNPEQPRYFKRVASLPQNYLEALKKWKQKNESPK
jgi:hypothetical protein